MSSKVFLRQNKVNGFPGGLQAGTTAKTTVHFEEYYEYGEMRFDYKTRPGVLTRTNGLNVMADLGQLPASKTDDSLRHHLGLLGPIDRQ